MLRLLHCFLESAPQLVLQLYILLQRRPFDLKNDLLTAVTAGCSLISMIWAILAYSKSLRDFRKQGYKLSLQGLFFQVLWRTCMVTSRVVAIVLFASYFQQWVFVAVGAHWLIMTMWLICQRTRFCTDDEGREHPCREKLFCAAIGFMYIFCFFNTREGMTRKRVVLFYSVMLVENSLFVSMWYPHRTFQGLTAFVALGVVWGGLALGVLCMILYYRYYHPSLPVQGICLQKRTFEFEGQRTYTWVCCGYCNIKQSGEDTIVGEGLMRNLNHSGNHQACAQPSLELEILPRSASQEILQEALGNHVSGPDSSILVHSTPARPVRPSSSHAKHPLVTSEVPRITVTTATPEVMSPVSNSSVVTLNEVNVEALDEVVQRSVKTSKNKPDRVSDSDNEKVTVTAASDLANVSHQRVKEERKSVTPRRGIDFKSEPSLTSPKSPTSREIISWFHPDQQAYGSDSVDECEERLAKINFGSLSFGNRYSLVSSDCLSLSSESSQSSVDSIMFADEGPGCSGVQVNKRLSGELTPRADEGIFSDERDSPMKGSVSTSEDPDVISAASTPQRSNVNAQFPVLDKSHQRDALQQVSRESPEKCRVMSPVREEGYELIELLMDAPSTPSSSLKRRARKVTNSVSSEETMENEIYKEEDRLVREESVSELEDGHESESTDVSSDSSHWRTLHHSYDEIEPGASGFQSSPDTAETNKRHTFDFSQLSKSPRSPRRRRRDRKYRRSKRKEFDNFVVTTLRPGKYGSLRRSIDRMAKIQEDAEETFLLNTEAALNACIPEDEDLSSPNMDIPSCEAQEKKEKCILKRLESNPSTESSNTNEGNSEEKSAVSARENYMRRKRLKRFLSKELAPGRFSSVRLSSESCPSDEDFSLFHNDDEFGKNRHILSADNLPHRHLNGERGGKNSDGMRRRDFSDKTSSLPTVIHSGNKPRPQERFTPKSNFQNAILYTNTESKTADRGESMFDPVPNKRHSCDFTFNSVDHIETKERLFGTDNDEKLSAVDRQHRRTQSEVLIGTTDCSIHV